MKSSPSLSRTSTRWYWKEKGVSSMSEQCKCLLLISAGIKLSSYWFLTPFSCLSELSFCFRQCDFSLTMSHWDRKIRCGKVEGMRQIKHPPCQLHLISIGFHWKQALGFDNGMCTLLISLTEEGTALFISTKSFSVAEHVILLKS